jgi:two-component system, NarL family, nitrate/nitrite response regulator NarL
MRRIVPTMIVGASALFREGLSRILGTAGFRVLASKSVLSEIDTGELPRADPCLLVVQCDDNCGSLIRQFTALKQEFPLIRIALLGHHLPSSEIAASFRAGANAYFAAATASDEFVNALGLIMSGHQAILPIELASSPSDTEQESQSPRVYFSKPLESDQGAPSEPVLRLSPRETSILRCLVRGASNKLIARDIQISEATVKVHVKAILRKIGVANRTQAAIWATTNAVRIAVEPDHRNSALALIPRSGDQPVIRSKN